MKERTLVNDSLLLITALIWGLAFVAQRAGMDHIGPFTFNGIRFLLGGLLLVPVAVRLRPLARARRRATTIAALISGGALFAAASLQQVGLVYTTAGNAGFITGLYVVMVPLIGLGRKQRAGMWRWIAVVLSIAGLYLLTLGDSLQPNRGDLLVIGSAFFFALHVQLIDHYAPRNSALWLSIIQYLVVGTASLAAGLLTEPLAMAGLRAAAVPILYGGIGSISIAYTLQVVAQRNAPPAHAAILLSLEGTFAAIGGALILGERLSTAGLIGCALMLGGMLLSQLARPVAAPAP